MTSLRLPYHSLCEFLRQFDGRFSRIMSQVHWTSALVKGLPFGARSYEHSTCVDVGRVAKRYPDVIAFAADLRTAVDKPSEEDKPGFGAKLASLFGRTKKP